MKKGNGPPDNQHPGDKKKGRLAPAVGEPWPEIRQVEDGTGVEGRRAKVLVGLVVFTGAILLAFAVYALIYKDERMISQILTFVLAFLSGVGGWAIGRSGHNNK